MPVQLVPKSTPVNDQPASGTPEAESNHINLFPTPLDGALWALERGLCVAPLTPMAKKPPLGPWKERSTRNKAEVLAMAAQHPGCNWLIDCGKSCITVLDEDVGEGKDGKLTTTMLEMFYGPFDKTTIVQTPSGGRHFYFRGSVANTVRVLGDGVDTRGTGGYVVCPGSLSADSVPYLLIRDDVIPPTPDWLKAAIKDRPAADHVAQVPVVELDDEASISKSVHYLKFVAKECIAHQGGDRQLIHVAGQLKNNGISDGLAVQLLSEHFNERCQPPWDIEDLERGVTNAYHYLRESAPGVDAPLYQFPDDLPEEGALEVRVGAAVQNPLPSGLCRGDHPEEDERKRRDINGAPRLLTFTDIENTTFNLNPPIDGLVDEGESILILGANGAGKSLAAVDLALTLALPPKNGLLWGRFKIAKPLKTLIVQSEVTCKGLKNRNRKMCPPGSPEAAAAAEMIRVASYGPSGRVTGDFMTDDFRKTLLGWINDFKPDVIIIDPLSSFHSQNENDSAEMRRTLDHFTAVCDEAGGLIHILIHHVGENSAGKGVFKGRGASSIGDWAANTVRIEKVAGGALKLNHDKARNFMEGPPIFFDRGPNLRLTPRAELATEGTDAMLHDLLADMGGEASSKSVLAQRVCEAKGVARTKGTDIVNDAVARGVLTMGVVKGKAIPILWKGSAADIFDDNGKDLENN